MDVPGDATGRKVISLTQDWLIHDSHDLFYRSPFGALACRQEVTLKLKVSLERPPEQVFLSLEREGTDRVEIEMFAREGQGNEGIYEATISAPPSPGLLWYYFRVVKEGSSWFCGSSGTGRGGASRTGQEGPSSYQITVYKEGTITPHWFKDAVIYQIFPDRFYNGNPAGKVSNPKKHSLIHAHWDNTPVYIRDAETGDVLRWDFFGGNLLGVVKKLPYLKSLGVKVIYFNPIFESPSNHRYDTADYHKVDSMLGSNEFFAALCAKARDMGISVILDGVFSHTGSDSIYFNKEGNYPSFGAYESQDSPYYKWYCFTDFPEEYESWWGVKTMPNVNELEPSYQDFIMNGEDSVVRYWLKQGAAGWRLDVADELPGPFIRDLRRTMKEVNPESVLIGEVWEDASNKISYGERRSYLLGDELDSVMNYPFRKILVDFILGQEDAGSVGQALLSLKENYPEEHFYTTMNLLGSHDQPRILTVFAEELPEDMPAREKKAVAKDRLKLAAFWQMTSPGPPSIYYGDEAGLEGGSDPLNRCTYPWGQEDQELVDFFREMTALRHHYDVLRTGDWLPVVGEGDVFGYLRRIEGGRDVFGQKKKDNAAVILINRSLWESRTVHLDVNAWFEEKAIDVLQDYREIPVEEGRLEVTLRPLEGKLLVKDRWGDNFEYRRECGLLLHPTSLPGPGGMGALGKEAYSFIDFLAASGQNLWQVLPLNPPGYGESPYQCYSAFAGNHLLIDLGKLADGGFLDAGDLADAPGFPLDFVDYQPVKDYRERWLRRAFSSFEARGGGPSYESFRRENESWLEDYALFMALKKHFGGSAWVHWERGAALREEEALKSYRQQLAREVDYHIFLQFIFYQQWHDLKVYAQSKGIRIVGDLPIFVAHDSSDVWTYPHLFALNPEGYPTKVAGVPPDYFSKTGQLWGNPHYRWDEMAKDDYRWWRERFQTLAGLVDIIRVDHFRGFEAYWEVPGGEKTAENGRWVKGPGEKFFKIIRRHLGHIPIIAEDLGVITPEVEELKLNCGYPGMKIMQFALEENPAEEFRLPLADQDTIVYTGTHDNDTILGWYKEKYRGHKDLTGLSDEEVCWYFIERAYHCNARSVIIPLQDVLALDSRYRMNIPGTAEGNWRWRFRSESLMAEVSERLRGLAEAYSFQRNKTVLID